MALNHVPKMFSARHVYNFYKDIASSKINNHCPKNKELNKMKMFCIYERHNEEGFWP